LHRPCTGRATEVTRPLSVGLPTSSHIQGKAGRVKGFGCRPAET
jgi:hypothetical protein